ncbi:hypothetical protein NDU88_005990, partial [Pleurodeles waltl]
PLRCRSYRLNRPLDSECLELSLSRARDAEQESRGRGNTTDFYAYSENHKMNLCTATAIW